MARGYGFIEYHTHRNALMGLRWLNGHAVDYRVKGEASKGKKAAKEALQDKKKRLIVEFAIENANVVQRRRQGEDKSKLGPKQKQHEQQEGQGYGKPNRKHGRKGGRDDDEGDDDDAEEKGNEGTKGAKGKRKGKGGAGGNDAASQHDKGPIPAKTRKEGADEKLAARTRIIARKRQLRKTKRGKVRGGQ